MIQVDYCNIIARFREKIHWLDRLPESFSVHGDFRFFVRITLDGPGIYYYTKILRLSF